MYSLKRLSTAGIVTGVLFAGISAIPVTVETIAARHITVSGEGCFELLDTGLVNDLSQKQYNALSEVNARPVRKAWCGTKFDTPERQPKEGDYWDTAQGRVFNIDTDKAFSFDEAKGEIQITKPLIQALINEAEAAIAFDAQANSAETTSATSVTVSVTVGSISNGVIVAASGTRNSGGGAFSHISSCTYNSVALTNAKTVDGPGAARFLTTEEWYLVAPASGAHNLVCNYDHTTDRIVMGGISFSGVAQTGTIDATASVSGAGLTAPWETTITTVADNAWIISSLSTDSDLTVAPSQGETEAWEVNTNGSPGDRIAASYKGPLTPAGGKTTGWTNSFAGADEVSTAVISLKPFVASAASSINDDSGWWLVQY